MSFQPEGKSSPRASETNIPLSFGRRTAACVFLGFVGFLFTAPRVLADPIDHATDHFDNAGKKITIERFEPKLNGKLPAVLLLHDSAGMETPGPFYRWGARLLANEGYVVLLVHYFSGTGHQRVKPDQIDKSDFQKWLDAVSGAVGYARKRPNIDSKKLGLLGFSLGGHLALSLVAQKNPEIAAVVELFGGLPRDFWKDLRSLPPTLIIHGDKDTVVPVKEALDLAEFFRSRKLPHELKVYEGQGHLFGANPKSEAALDAQKRTLAFFEKHLKQQKREKNAR